MNRSLVRLTFSLIPALAGLTATAQTVLLDSVVVTSSRSEETRDRVPFSVRVMDGEAARRAPTATLDGALRSVPGFSLFRRSDSLTANPTAQGVSLRGIGPSGASRSLVLLDGIPLNDPFGGWVAWTKLPRESLARVEVLPGGGATAWGNAALGGVINLITEAPGDTSGRALVLAGDFNTRGFEGTVSEPIGPGTLELSGRVFRTEGFRTVASERRGPIDRPAGNRHRWLSARWRQLIGGNAQVTVIARRFEEQRANGTPFQRNASGESFGAVSITAGGGSPFSWEATGYLQDQSFSSTFSGVNASRTAETPASDQFAVPSTTAGLGWTGRWQHADGGRTTAGFDARQVRGETREHVSFVSGAFTRRRVAGGRQQLTGIFGLHERQLSERFTAMAGLRADGWRESRGHRRENDRATGSTLRNDVFSASEDLEFSPSAGLVWRASESLRLRFAAQQAFRRPTLNELYRPFRVGNVITEANAALRTETITSAEIGAHATHGKFAVNATIFWNELRDAVANVTVVKGPINLPEFGFIPAGGSGRRRLNLDLVRVQGGEFSLEWRPVEALAVNADYLYDDATVRRAAVAVALEGRQIAQVPRHHAGAGVVWKPSAAWTVAPRVRWVGAQFEDDENLLKLAHVVIADVSVSYAFGRDIEVFVTVENLAGARIETGRSADGLVNTGTPRFATFGVRAKW